VQAAVMLPLGVALFVAPGHTSFLWPWAIPDLSARALSAWVLAFGVLSAHALRENDFDRVRVAFLAYPVFVVLQAIALARYGSVIDWGEAGAWIYVAFLATATVLGAYGIVTDRRRTVAKWVEPEPGAPAFSA